MKNFRKYFIKAIKTNYPDQADRLVGDMEEHYAILRVDTAFAARSANPIDRRLDMCTYFLAFIKTLDEEGRSFEEIRKICLEVVTAYVQPRNRLHLWMKRLPALILPTWFGKIMVRWLKRKLSRKGHPDGFVATIITDPEETYGFGYGFDINECGICKLFEKHDYYQYASILCEVDEITSALAGLKLIRTGTIANGAHKCDFRFQRLKDQGIASKGSN